MVGVKLRVKYAVRHCVRVYIYIYICVCVCVCVCISLFLKHMTVICILIPHYRHLASNYLAPIICDNGVVTGFS